MCAKYSVFLLLRSETCERLRQEKQLEFIPPYDHPDVIAGQVIQALIINF